MNSAVIGIGSNISAGTNIRRAIRILAREQRIVKRSAFVRSAAIGPPGQHEFINGVALIETPLEREGLRLFLRDVEARLGRVRTSDKYAPRTIDLDIVVWNGTVVSADFYSRQFLRDAVNKVSNLEVETPL
jgi:2-amino-4-hydroxy-6-hydroxymethyldihydropteridine diphosphokinase